MYLPPAIVLFTISTLYTAQIPIATSSEVPRPRGVSLSRAPLYSPDRKFRCLDSTKTIPFSQVNDDYCDCDDGTDEPGTSACPNGSFYCTNAGHKPLSIASSRVNDLICDCCDGSDEYSASQCPNNCVELGRHAREEAQKRAELLKAGKQLRAELSQKGVQAREEKKTRLKDLEQSKTEAEALKSEKKQLKDEAEELENKALEFYRRLEEEERKKREEEETAKSRAEAVETFHKFDSNQDGLVDLSELQTRQSFDKNRDGQVDEEEAKYFLNNEASVDLEKFVADAWPLIKPYLMVDAGIFKPPTTPAPTDEAQDMEEEPEEEEVEEEPEEEEHHDEETATESAPSSTQYDSETQKLVDLATAARNEHSEAESSLRSIEREIDTIKNYLENDYGTDEEFATLHGQCFELTDHEYTYKLCPFDYTVQLPNSGSETRLGSWGHWDGPHDNKYESMVYDKGQSCWNGPQRSTKVRLHCATENRVIAVSEPNRCEYLFDFETPAACKEESADETNDDVHDEL